MHASTRASGLRREEIRLKTDFTLIDLFYYGNPRFMRNAPVVDK